jgi:LVIVD repeat-containing protein
MTISDPAKPREVGFFKTDVAPRRGVHGFWLHEDPKQGKFAFIATTKEGYHDNILMILDINDPAHPKEVARWWFPGQWIAGGEKPGENWVEPDRGLREGLPKICGLPCTILRPTETAPISPTADEHVH